MKDLRIVKIKLEDLESFYQSSHFKSLVDTPISYKRVTSYLKNTNGIRNANVLYLGYLDDSGPVAYRSVFQDLFFPVSKFPRECVWLSGVWTHPDHQRKGYAKLLLDEICKDYNGMLFVTNMANKSYQLIQGSKHFIHMNSLNGHRFYYRLPLYDILPPKSAILSRLKSLLKATDLIVNYVIDFKIALSKKVSSFHVEPAEFNEELNTFISKHTENSLFQRNVKDFSWILEYPWVIQNQEDESDKKYYFTTSEKRFYQRAMVVKSEEQIKGFIFYTVKNNEMKIQYVFYDSEKEAEEFSNFILNAIKQDKISYLTVIDEYLSESIKKKQDYLFYKNWKKDIFAGRRLLENYPEIEDKNVYMGDGDGIFT